MNSDTFIIGFVEGECYFFNRQMSEDGSFHLLKTLLGKQVGPDFAVFIKYRLLSPGKVFVAVSAGVLLHLAGQKAPLDT